MSDDFLARVIRIAEQAMQLEGDARETFLERACEGDPELEAEVRRILADDTADPEFLAPPDLTPAERAAGHRLGDYVLESELGRGGMAVVYRGKHLSTGLEVAIKVLTAGLTTTERQLERFGREARALQAIDHPGIVRVHDVGADGDTHWYAMDLVEGHDLERELLLQRKPSVLADHQPLLPRPGDSEHARRIAQVAAEAAEALQHAHENGVVHRDVKPSNLLLGPDGSVQLADFGIARDENEGTITRTGELGGTPRYMSPEQARIQDVRVDHRTDIYSLGVVLYELATLVPAYDGQTIDEVFAQIRRSEPDAPRKLNARLPRDLELICLKAMAKERGDRYETAGELAADLRRFLAFEAIEAKPPSMRQLAARWTKRRRRPLIAAALTILGATFGGVVVAKQLEDRGRAIVDLDVTLDRAPLRGGRVRVLPITLPSGSADASELSASLKNRVLRTTPGFRRLEFELPDGSLRWFSTHLDLGENRLSVPLRSDARPASDMVRIEGGLLALRDGEDQVPIPGVDVEVGDLLVDRYEVSNADYRLFLQAFPDRPRPDYWSELRPEHDDLPVADVSWVDARDYAAWVGKRLPTVAEWLWCARGASGRRLPWVTAADQRTGTIDDTLRGNVFQPPFVRGTSLEELNDPSTTIAAYFERTAGVRSFPEAATPEGIHHLLGNVAEWTETAPSSFADGDFVGRPEDRIVVGWHWSAAQDRADLSSAFLFSGISHESRQIWTGFRCVVDAD